MRGKAINGLTRTIEGFGKRAKPKLSVQDLERAV